MLEATTTLVPETPTTTTEVAAVPVPVTQPPDTTPPAASEEVPQEPILCGRYRHPLHHLTCAEADERSATRKAPVAATAPKTMTAASARSGSRELASIRACEQGEAGYATNTGNGFYGAYQFLQSTWESVGGTGNPANASPAEQDRRAQMMIDAGRRSEWPNC